MRKVLDDGVKVLIAILSKLAADQRPLERAMNNTKARLIADARKGENQ